MYGVYIYMVGCLIRENPTSNRFGKLLIANFCKALRNIIAKSPPSLPEEEAKASIIDKINEFINTRITLAAKEIAKNAITKIRDGDVILTYGRFVVCFGSSLGLLQWSFRGNTRALWNATPQQRTCFRHVVDICL